MPLFATTLYHHENGRLILHAMPVMATVLVVLAIAYRYYSAFLAAKVAALDDSRVTPAHRLNDGQNYHPTNKWVLFGHHFAAISGAGPLIGPVLAIQYGYMPGLLWLVIGVCLAGAVQDMLVLAASVRRDGKSIAEIARHELGKPAAVIASIAILFIVVIALAGLGFVVVKALGGEEASLPAWTRIIVPGKRIDDERRVPQPDGSMIISFPPGCFVGYPGEVNDNTLRSEAFLIRCPEGAQPKAIEWGGLQLPSKNEVTEKNNSFYTLPAGCTQVIPGSSWGTFTLACTIPIAMFVGLWMYRIRPGKVLEASLIGGGLTFLAVFAGGEIHGTALESIFTLTRTETIIALVVYGFIAAVLPVWLLLGPRDYLSSFLKIGTVILLIASVCIANPPLQAPMVNEVFVNGGPTFPGSIFPFVFICVMCGAVSGFHSLVSSGTTPKMIEKESHIRTIGYGAMLIEGLVGVTALIAAASLPNALYYDINIAIDRAPEFTNQLKEMDDRYGRDPNANLGTENLHDPTLGPVEKKIGGESLRGRTGGAVTLAVGMSLIFEDAFTAVGFAGEGLLKYWYHFAIMFEALFILTTIDAGTRIGRFLLQETVGRVFKPFARPDWLPGALLASAIITGGWGWLIYTGSIDTIWPMFGIANQALAVLALALVTTWLINTGRMRYAFVTLVPMLWVCSTTLSAGAILVSERFPMMIDKGNKLIEAGKTAQGNKLVWSGYLSGGLTLFVLCSVGALVIWAVVRWIGVLLKMVPTRRE